MKKHILFLCALAALVLSCSKDGYYDYKSGAYGYGESADGSSVGSGDSGNSQAGKVTAGEWNDLNHWQFWSKLMNNQGENGFSGMPDYWGFDTRGRVAVHVTNPDGSPAINTLVQLSYKNAREWETRTDNHGNASLWLGLYGMPEEVESTAVSLTVAGTPVAKAPLITAFRDTTVLVNEIALAAAQTASNKADIAFIVDATGSMYDEIDFLKDDLLDILNKVKDVSASNQIRTGALFYRDEGDDYVTIHSDFSSDVKTTHDFINKQKADGGGDYPEAVHTALAGSLQSLSWDPEARSRIAFLILDAPAHHEKAVIESLHKSVTNFAKNGIRLIPVTASGTDKNTEFMCRFFAIATGGTYVFITNDSGIGGNHIEASVGEYEVELLNSLMVRLINEYIE